MTPVLEAPDSKCVGQGSAWPGFSAWLSVTFTVGSQVNHATALYLGFLTCRTKRGNRSHLALHSCKPATLLWAQMMMCGEDNLGNMTSCLQPGGDSPAVSDAVPGGSQVTKAQAGEPCRAACRLRRGCRLADDSRLLPERHLSQFVPILPNIPTAGPSFHSDDRLLFQRAQESFFKYHLYLSNSTWRNRLCLVITGNCPRRSCIRQRQKEAGKEPGAFRRAWATTGRAWNAVLLTIFHTVQVVVAYCLKTRLTPPSTGNVAPRVQHQPLPTPHHGQPGRDLDTAPLRSHNPLILNLPWPLTLEKGSHLTSSSGSCTSFWKCTGSGSPWAKRPSAVAVFPHSAFATDGHSYGLITVWFWAAEGFWSM